jgi:hypothetical protein
VLADVMPQMPFSEKNATGVTKNGIGTACASAQATAPLIDAWRSSK